MLDSLRKKVCRDSEITGRTNGVTLSTLFLWRTVLILFATVLTISLTPSPSKAYRISFSNPVAVSGASTKQPSDGHLLNARSTLAMQSSCVTPPSGMLGWWPGDGNSNDVIGANNGSYFGGATYASGEVGQGFGFNGTDSGVSIPDSTELRPQQLTVEAWVKFDTLDSPTAPLDAQGHNTSGLQYLAFKLGQGGPISQNLFEAFSLIKLRNGNGTDSFYFFVGSAQEVNVRASVASVTSIQVGQFYHVAGTYDGVNLKIYVNGVLEGTQAATFSIGYYIGKPLMLGTTGESFDAKLKGTLDEVGLYNRALNASEIQASSNAGTSGKCKQPITCSQPRSGVVGWWPGDGHVNDIIGGNNGSLQGNATYTANGVVGQAFSFDGNNSYVQIPDATSLKPANVTVDAWVKFDSLNSPNASVPGLQYLVFKKNSRTAAMGFFEGYALFKWRDGDGKDRLYFMVSSSAGAYAQAISTTVVTTGRFYHAAGTYDGSNAKIYVNGVLEATVVAPGHFPLDYGTRPVFFGTSDETFNGKLTGELDEVSIYNRALGASEIQAINNAGTNGKCKGLDLGITLGHTGTPIAGQNITYNLSVTNVGNVRTTSVITVTDTLPSGTTFVSTGAGTDSGWSCGGTTTVTCTNSNQMVPGSTSQINLVATATQSGGQTNSAQVSIIGDVNSSNDATTDNFGVIKPSPTINWSNPADIFFGTLLSSTQLNATATFNSSSVAGTFVYTPPVGTLLNIGNQQTLSVTFTPTDTATYASATATVSVNVVRDTANDVTYAYDKLGRLNAVVDAAGNAAIYNYDAVGNLLSIVRESASQPSIFSFLPDSGPVGASVTIFGHGFSGLVSGNTVSFNGTAATVVSASANQLQVTVPSGATTGAITVVSPAGTSVSSNSFTVTATGTTSITGFSPSIGVPYSPTPTSVTITGNNFGSTPETNQLRFNLNGAAVNTASPTSITATVPPGTGSGRISVVTPFGSATSTTDFFIPPAPLAVTDIGYTHRMSFGDTITVSVSTSGQHGLIVFDGAAGQRVSIDSVDTGFIQLYDTNGIAISGANSFLEPQTLPETGTYSILATPLTGSTTETVKLYNVPPDVSLPIATDGTPITGNIVSPGQNGTWFFNGTPGQRISVSATNMTLAGTFYVYTQNGALLINSPFIPIPSPLGPLGSWYSDTLTLPLPGRYTIVFDAYKNYAGTPGTLILGVPTGSISVAVYNVPPDLTGYLTSCWPSADVTTTVPGQGAKFLFGGVAGRRVSLRASAAGNDGRWSIVKPDGQELYSINQNIIFTDARVLPLTGIYTVQFHDRGVGFGNINVTLFNVPPDVSGTITVNGSPVTAILTAPGQNAEFMFSGTVGEIVSINLTGTTFTSATLKIINPDSSLLLDANGNVSRFSSNGWAGGTAPGPFTLPATGTYTISIDPISDYTGSITFGVTSSNTAQNMLLGTSSVAKAIVLPSPTAAPSGICSDSQKIGQIDTPDIHQDIHSDSWFANYAFNTPFGDFVNTNQVTSRVIDLERMFAEPRSTFTLSRTGQ